MTSPSATRRLTAEWKTLLPMLALFGAGVYLVYGVILTSWHNHQLTERGEITSGHITELWEDIYDAEQGATRYHHGGTYTYQLPDGQQLTGSIEGEGRLKPEFRYLAYPNAIPYAVEVLYLPSEPTVSIISGDLPDTFWGTLRRSAFEIFMAAWLVFFGFWLLRGMLRRLQHPPERQE